MPGKIRQLPQSAMTRPIALLALMCACAAAAGIGSIVNKVGEDIKEGIEIIKQPIEEGILNIASSQCSTVKKILGLSVDSYQGKEPDMNDLTLEFRNSDVTVSFNLTTAAELIPNTEGYDPRQKLYIFVHGFTSDPSAPAFGNISTALFSRGKINVLALDASAYIANMYLRSSTYVVFIGEKLGKVLARMVKDGLDPDQIHIIGHSLGAHISGFTGKQLFNNTGRRLGRISGLDPAGPCYSNLDDSERLNATDAKFVDVIHTDAGIFGLNDNVGHVDYWPNGGSMQPGCESCSHSRSWQFFTESVLNPKAFPAVKCGSWDDFKKHNCSHKISFMGFACSSSASGSYYLQTGSEWPFGLGINGTVYVKPQESNHKGILDKIISAPQTILEAIKNGVTSVAGVVSHFG